jgi:hypothetical protein
MRKRDFSVLLAFICLLGLTAFPAVYAAGNPAIMATASAPGANGEFDVTVSILGNPGIAYFSLRLHFDKAKVEPVSVTRGSALPVGSITSNVNVANIDFVTAVWSDADGSGANGTLYTVRFKARDGATGKVVFSLTEHGIFDSSHDMSPVSATLNGNEIDFGTPTAETPNTDTPNNDLPDSPSEPGSTATPTPPSAPDSNNNSYENSIGEPADADYTVTLFDNTADYTPAIPWINPFTDVRESDWFYEAVKFAHQRGLVSGTSATTFSPQVTMTRAMMVTILWNYAGQPNIGSVAFTDVPDGRWYSGAVNWAAANRIVSGIGNNRFAPSNEITREQMAVMLYNYSKFINATLPHRRTGAFVDDAQINSWAKEAVAAMYAAEVLNGKGQNNFDPQGRATRAEVVAMMRNFLESIGG